MIIEPHPELEFRDGPRVVPPHVAQMMSDIETYRFTFEEAMKLANASAMKNYLAKAQRSVISDHFRENR